MHFNISLDHGRQLGKTISQMTQLIANAKVSATGTGSAAMKKLMPSSTPKSSFSSTYAEPAQEAITTNEESHQGLEKRFTNLKSSLVDKYHSSKQ